MTRSLFLVNTSNGDGEDYRIAIDRGGFIEHHDLKPGIQVIIPSYKQVTITVTPIESKPPVPFFDDEGKQITPQMTVEFK